MITLEKIINASFVEDEDSHKRVIKQLSILYGISVKDLNNKTVTELDILINDCIYIFDNNKISPIYQFSYNGINYSLPKDLGMLPYAKWQDLTNIIQSDKFGKNSLDKLPYILGVIFYNGDYFEDYIDLASLRSYWLNLDGKIALGVLSFFLLEEKSSYVNLVNYIELNYLKMSIKFQKMRLLRNIIPNGVYMRFEQLLQKIRDVRY